MIGSRTPKPRRFSYEPHYYDPKKEEREGRRIKFKRTRTRSQARTRSLIWLFILLFLIVYVILFLSRLGKMTDDMPAEGEISLLFPPAPGLDIERVVHASQSSILLRKDPPFLFSSQQPNPGCTALKYIGMEPDRVES